MNFQVSCRVAFTGGDVGARKVLRAGISKEDAEKLVKTMSDSGYSKAFTDIKVEPMDGAALTIEKIVRQKPVPGVGQITDTTVVKSRFPTICGSFLAFPCSADEVPPGIYGSADNYEKAIASHDEPIGRGQDACAAITDLAVRNAAR
jgi:hypothetical protein